MTQHLLFLAIANSLWCLAIHVIFTNENMVGYSIGNWMTKVCENDYWITKPLYNCMPCMASFHGVIGYLFIIGEPSLYIIPYCVILCGINILISKFYYFEIN